MQSTALGNGLTQTDQYYPWNQQGGRLYGITAVHIPDQTNVQALNYGYDLGGNITTISDNVNSEVQSYGYDALNRLTSWTLNNGQPENYGYSDTTGNLSSKAGVTLQYTDGNHDHAVTQTNNNPYATYDANGNQVTRVWNGQTYTQTYDTENRLVSVKIGQTTIASFVYDGDGNRVQSIIGSTTTTFVGNYYEVSGENITQYYYAGTQRVAMRKDGTLTFMLSDQLGSTSVTTDSSGQNPTTLEYDPWGGTRFASKDGNGNDNTPTNYRYTGQRQEPSFGLYFYQARWYDPATGRFAQADSVVPNGVQGYDRYAYVNNDPINATDPTGHRDCDEDGYNCSSGYDYLLNAHISNGNLGTGEKYVPALGGGNYINTYAVAGIAAQNTGLLGQASLVERNCFGCPEVISAYNNSPLVKVFGPADYGIAKTNQDELTEFGISGSPTDDLTNVKVMTARISSVTNACKGCTATDILLAAAGGQNGGGFTNSDIGDLERGIPYGNCAKNGSCEPGTTLNWRAYYTYPDANNSYNAKALPIFAHFVAVLKSQGWSVPDVNWDTIASLSRGVAP